MDELKLEVERLKKEIEYLTNASKSIVEAQVVENSKERIKKWIIGNSIYVIFLLTVLGITSFKEAKDALIQDFKERSMATIGDDLKKTLGPEIKKEVKEDLIAFEKQVGDEVSASHQQIVSSLEKDINNVSSQVSKKLQVPMDIQANNLPKSGYVFRNYLKEIAPEVYSVTPFTLVVRKNPRGEVTGKLPKDTKVKITSNEGKWVQIELVE